MAYFSKDYLAFFRELAANNHKEWFDANRKRYEKEVKEPFKYFISALILALEEAGVELDLEPKDAIFRINRDIRFSKDKTPYKTNNSALISPEGRKNKNHPGIYIEFGPEKLSFYGGIYMPSPKEVLKVRTYMAENVKALKQCIEADDFVKNFGGIEGEESKRIPKELMEAAEINPLIWKKQWFYHKDMAPETVLADDLMESLLKLEKAARPTKEFLHQAII